MTDASTDDEPAERRLVELFWGSALSLALISGTTPRTLLEQMFRLAPSDDRWRDVDRHEARATLRTFLTGAVPDPAPGRRPAAPINPGSE